LDEIDDAMNRNIPVGVELIIKSESRCNVLLNFKLIMGNSQPKQLEGLLKIAELQLEIIIGFNLDECDSPKVEVLSNGSNFGHKHQRFNGYLSIAANWRYSFIIFAEPGIRSNIKTSFSYGRSWRSDADWKKCASSTNLGYWSIDRQLPVDQLQCLIAEALAERQELTARFVLVASAAKLWNVPAEEIL